MVQGLQLPGRSLTSGHKDEKGLNSALLLLHSVCHPLGVL